MGSAEIFCVRTVPAKTKVAAGAEDLPTDPVQRTVLDNTREVAARRSWEGCIRHFAEHVLHVAGVDGGGLDPHRDLAGLRHEGAAVPLRPSPPRPRCGEMKCFHVTSSAG